MSLHLFVGFVLDSRIRHQYKLFQLTTTVYLNKQYIGFHIKNPFIDPQSLDEMSDELHDFLIREECVAEHEPLPEIIIFSQKLIGH